MAADIADRLYYFQDFKCTVAGVDYAVMSVVLAMQESGIPTVVLTINPQDKPNAADISTASVEEFSAWHSKLQAKANTAEGKVNLSFSVKSKSDTQKIDLKDWLLTQVGFDNIAASGGFNAKLVIQHPVYAATNAVLAMLDTYYDSGIGDSLTKSDIVTMILASMDKYLKQKNPNTKKEDASVVSEDSATIKAETVKAIDVVLHKKAVDALKALKNSLEWDPDYKGGNTPFPGVEGFDDHLALSGLEVGAYLIDRASPYHTFMAMAGQMILTTRGAFNNDKLRVRPFEPWAASELKIKVDELTQIALPVYSVNAVSGVVTMGSERTLVISNAADGSVKGQREQGPTVIFGGYLEMAARVDGYVRSINMPDWITAFVAGDPAGPAMASQGGQNSNPSMSADGKTDPDVDNSTLEFSATLETMLNAYGHDDFWRGFRADVTVSAGLKLTLAKDGKPLRPGIVVDLVSGDDKVVLTCYIISVQHTISVQDAQAYTSVVGSYVRGPEGVGSGDARVYNPGSPVTSAIYSKAVKGSGTKKSAGASKTPAPSKQIDAAEEAHNKFNAGMPTGVS